MPRCAASAAAAFLLLNALAAQFKAGLHKRNDEFSGGDVMAHCRPVVAAGGTRAALYPLAEFLFKNVLPVMRPAAYGIELIPDVLENGFLMPEIFARLAVELPEDTVFPDGEEQTLAGIIYQHALEHDIEVERFGGSMLVVPGHFPCIHIDGQSRAAEKRVIVDGHPATGRHPRFRLGGSPEREIQIGIVAARDPAFRACAEQVRQFAPGISSGLAFARDGIHAPELLTGRRIISANETFFFAIRGAITEALNDLALGDDRAARCAVIALAAVADDGFPDLLAVLGINRNQMRIRCRQNDLVFVNADAAHRVARSIRAVIVFPNQFTVACVERLQGVTCIVEIHHSVVNDRGGLGSRTFGHRPDPFQPQVLRIVPSDLVQRAVIGSVIVPANHEPVVRTWVAQHGIGNANIVLYLSGNSNPTRLAGRAAAASALAASLTAVAVRIGLRRCGFGGCCLRLAGGDGVNGHFGIRRQCLIAGTGSVGLKHERNDAQIFVLIQNPLTSGRHRELQERQQFSRRTRTPV